MEPGSSSGRMPCADRSEAKTTRGPVDLCSVPTGSQRPVDVGSEPTVVERRAAAETKKLYKTV